LAVIPNVHAVIEVVVGPDVKGAVVRNPVANVEIIVLKLVGLAPPVAASVMTKVQGCMAALVEWVVVLALRGGSLFSEDADLNLLAFGSSVGR